VNAMTAAAEAPGLPFGEPLTRADLDAMPDDGHRYELIDGVLVVTPSPRPEHQGSLLELAVLLRAACPPELKVYVAPFDVELAPDTIVQPDLLVTRRADITRRGVAVPPVLAVEVLSPSTRRFDLMLKRSRYEAAGCPNYWVVDPEEPSIVAWELRDGAYVEVGRASGEQSVTLDLPFPVTVVPVRLLD
jgi:Uma2 family endonuclease